MATVAMATAMATEEEECDKCNGADPRRRLDDFLLRQADGILLRSIATTTALRHGGGGDKDRDGVDAWDQHWHVVHGWEDWEGDDGSGVATEDDDDTDVGAGGTRTISWGLSSADFWRGVSGGGGRQ